jgi:hypothetical protein
MGRNSGKPQEPFADEALEPSLVLRIYDSPIRGVHAAANPILRLASISPNFLSTFKD